MTQRPWIWGNSLIGVDPVRRRLWVGGQRLHHGLTGSVLAGLGMAGVAARRMSLRGGIEWTLLGAMLMVHDWKDRGIWFEPGKGRQE